MTPAALAFREPETRKQAAQLVAADGLIASTAEEPLQCLAISSHAPNLALNRWLALSNA